MLWVEVLAVFVLCHLAGDFLFQTDFQGRCKSRGLGRDPARRRALFTHVLTYTVAFVPALIWIGGVRGVWIAAAIAIPHLLIDDGRALRAYVRRVKRVPGDPPAVVLVGTDQTLHLLCLGAAAALA